jgi:uncharacterized protein with beta-barrel porin domain
MPTPLAASTKKIVEIFSFFLFFQIVSTTSAGAVVLGAGDTNYLTSSDITTSGIAISSTLVGTSGSPNRITNLHNIATGASGTISGSYGIRTSGNYNIITNAFGASILTTGASGRGVSITNNSSVINQGAISTQGTTAYGIYVGGDNNSISNFGSVSTINSTAYGIYLNGDNNSANNAGSIATRVYGIYASGNVNQVSSSGTITTTTSSAAHGIYVSAASASTASATSYSTITNSGTISSSGHGIYNRDNYSLITNSGTITSGAGASIYGIRNDADNVIINNSGAINSTNYAIYNAGSSAQINNLGDLSGGVYVGAGTLNIFGGTISGAVNGAERAGSVVVGSSLYPSVIFNQSADFDELSNLTIQSGSTLNSAAKIDATRIDIAADSTLNLNFATSSAAPIYGVLSGVGTVNVNGISFSTSGAIGDSLHQLQNLNILTSGALTALNDIYATNIFLDGALNFSEADNLTITGNLAGSGAGRFDVGDKNQNFIGNFTLNSGDIFVTTLAANRVGSLDVTGAATISSGTKLAILVGDSNYIADGTTYDLVNASAPSSLSEISAENISVNGSSNVFGLLRFTTIASGNSLVLAANHLQPNEVTPNKNAQNIYKNLVQLGRSSSGKLLEFQKFLDFSNLPSDEITATINQLAPQSSKASLLTTTNFVRNFQSISQNRLQKIHNLDVAQDLSHGFWGRGFGASSLQNAIKDDDGFKTNSVGIIFGIDKEIADETTAGAAFAYGRSKINHLDKSKENIIDSYALNFYAAKNFDKIFVDFLGSFAFNNFNSNRAITALNTNALARYSGQTYALKTDISYQKNLGFGFNLAPQFSLNFVQNKISAYRENGADELNLNVSGVSANFLEARAGLDLSYAARIATMPEFRKFFSNVKISYGQALINDAPVTSARFTNQQKSFENKISNLDSNSLQLGLEMSLLHKDDTTLSVNYGFEHKKTADSHLVFVGALQRF